MKRILVPTSGLVSAASAADYVAQVAGLFRAQVHVLHVFEDQESSDGAATILQLFSMACEENDIPVTEAIAFGSIVEQIVLYADQHAIDLILMGASNGQIVEQWLSHDVLGHTAVPVLVMPYETFELPIAQPEFTAATPRKPWSFSNLLAALR